MTDLLPRHGSVSAPAAPATMPAADRPRVLFVGDQLGHPGGVVHGLTTYFNSVLPGLARQGVLARLCLLGRLHPAAASLAANGVEPVFFNRRKWDPRVLHDLGRLVRALRVEILHLTNLKAIPFGCLLAQRAGLATVLHFHDQVLPPFPLRPLLRRLARRATTTIAVSDQLRDFVAATYQLPPARIEVLHNGVDLGGTPPSAANRAVQRARLGLADGAPVIAIVGRIAPIERQALLIRTMPAVLRARPETVLLVVGDGSERRACEAEARRLGVGAAVRFLGQRDDVADILAATDVLALTSSYEGLPYVILEAAAMAVPAVAFATGGVPEMVRHEATGLLVSPDDAEALASALIRLIRAPDLARRLGGAAREQVRRFDLELYLARLTGLYRRLLARAPAREAWRVRG
jgi:glycosyltransferase involved in cell wall biosynthesis